jgi:hypothetical protein
MEVGITTVGRFAPTIAWWQTVRSQGTVIARSAAMYASAQDIVFAERGICCSQKADPLDRNFDPMVFNRVSRRSKE